MHRQPLSTPDSHTQGPKSNARMLDEILGIAKSHTCYTSHPILMIINAAGGCINWQTSPVAAAHHFLQV
jgi:hypothetical protein